VFLWPNVFRILHAYFQFIIWPLFKILTINESSASGLPTSTPVLQPQSPRRFALQPSARVSPTLRPSYHSHVTAAATYADQYWHLHRADCRNTLIYAHTNSRTLLTCDISLGSLTIPTLEAGDFVELILVHMHHVLINDCSKIKCRDFSDYPLEKGLVQFSWKSERIVGAWSVDI
jgi:hypothetical protein